MSLVQLNQTKKDPTPKSMASQYVHGAAVEAGQTQYIFNIPGPGRLRSLLLSANPYAAYTVVDSANPGATWLPFPYAVPGSALLAPAGSLQPAQLVLLFASAKQLTYSGLAVNALISFNASDWAGAVVTDANGNVVLENFYLNPPSGWYFAGYLQVAVSGIAANTITVVSATVMVEVYS